MANIVGGYIILPRQIQDNDIWLKNPAWWLKVWFFILMRVNHQNKDFKRGCNFFNSRMIYEQCNLAQEGITIRSIENVIRTLRNTQRITTQKTTRGIVITVCNYEFYQNYKNYKNGTENVMENVMENGTGTEQERNRNGTINKKGKNEKNEKKLINSVLEKSIDNIYDIENLLLFFNSNFYNDKSILGKRALQALVNTTSFDRVKDAVKHMLEYQKTHKIPSPAGFLVTLINEGWAVN